MKILFVSLLSVIAVSAFANDHIEYYGSAVEAANTDPCIGVAVNGVIEKLMNEISRNSDRDPSDLDIVYITAAKKLQNENTYVISAGESRNRTKKYWVDVQCSSKVR